MSYIAVKDLKKTRLFRERLDREGEMVLTKDGQPFALLISVDPDSAEESLIEVRRSLFSSAVMRARRKAALIPPAEQEIAAEIEAVRSTQ